MKIKINLFIVFCLSFISCNPQQGHNGVSENISDSKDRGVFICEYMAPENPYHINDSIILTIKEAWIEKRWKYSKNNSSVIWEGYQLCINTEPEKHLEDLGFGWSIGVDYERNMRTSSATSLISDFKMLPPDTIEYKVQKGDELSNNYEKVIIGKFVLIRKK
ncbi:MAG: hypothetical protein Q8T03_13285 [Bacteroidota bacterium]|nr:hypothetical protein [Bacteroidota bacterium]MDP3558339.1 hypothetical protein [Bacteroidota bacterium]